MAKSTTTSGKKRTRKSCEIESQMDLFPVASSTRDPSKRCQPTSSGDSLNATFSPGSEGGRSLSGNQDGPTTGRSGQAPALASLTAAQAKERGLLTSGTYGLLSIGSSSSTSLQSFLENRLQKRTQSLGSTLYKLTWKPWTTPLGPSRFRLQAWGRPISETDCTGWPTPKEGKSNGRGNPNRRSQGRIEDVVQTIALIGPGTLGSAAAMASDVRLNPEFSRWLMGFPAQWTQTQPTETPLSSPPPERSLKRISTIRWQVMPQGWSEITLGNISKCYRREPPSP